MDIVTVLQQSDLNQFSGTENHWKHWTGLIYTDGTRHVAIHGQAHWLIDLIAFCQQKCKSDPSLLDYQFWTLRVNLDRSAVLTCERDTDDVAFTEDIPLTDFPLSEIKLYVVQGVLMLPSEY